MKRGVRLITIALTSTVLVGAFLAATAGSAGAATPRCFGKKPTIIGTNRAEELKGTAKPDVIVGLGGADEIEGLGGNDLICGGPGSDALDGGRGNDRLSGGPGRDTIWADVGNDELFGDGGNDVLLGYLGDDAIAGGSGWDDAWFSEAPGSVNADLSTGRATGEGIDRLIGIEALTGSAFDDILVGDENANGFQGMEGEDSIDGGGGLQDAVSYWHSAAAVTVDLTSGLATGGEDTDTLTGIEWVWGGMFNDTITGDANANHLFGVDGNDTISGLDGDDSIYGLDGNDAIDAGDGNDAVDGGPGTDSCVNGEDVTNCES
jgi:Ca2+-binding RTX toxin-like protein